MTDDSPRRALNTGDAARYLGISPSLMRKMRLRAPGDPLGSGPRYIKLSPQLIVYDIKELDAWLDGHKVDDQASYKPVEMRPIPREVRDAARSKIREIMSRKQLK